jgi:CRP-like cAMP-binding protein
MDRHDRIEEQLTKVPLFEGLSKKELRLVSRLATPLEEPAGTVLVREGTRGREFIVVLAGEIEVRKGDRVVATLGPGSYVGEIALLDHRPRTATVVATTPVSIEVIGQQEFAGLLSKVPEICPKLIPMMAARLADLDEQQGGPQPLLRAQEQANPR